MEKQSVLNPEELIARIRVLMNERMQLTQDYQQRFARVTEEIQAYQRQLHELQAGKDHDMPF